IRYTHSHANSLRALRAQDRGDTIAFVWSGVFERDRTDQLRTVKLPALARMRVPPDALLVRAGLPQLARLKAALGAPAAAGSLFHAGGNWRAGAADVRAWLAAAGTPAPDRLMRLDLDEVAALLLHDARSQPTPLRLAIVFSGGGAKCSYQI